MFVTNILPDLSSRPNEILTENTFICKYNASHLQIEDNSNTPQAIGKYQSTKTALAISYRYRKYRNRKYTKGKYIGAGSGQVEAIY